MCLPYDLMYSFLILYWSVGLAASSFLCTIFSRICRSACSLSFRSLFSNCACSFHSPAGSYSAKVMLL